MTTYTVHHRASTASEILHRSEEAVFVKEGFSWPALFIPFLWLLYNRLWFAFFGYVALVAGIALVGTALSLSEVVINVLSLGANVLLAFEGNNLRRWTLRGKGYYDVGVVIGRPLMEAERRFFQSLIDHGGLAPDPAPVPDQKPIQVATALGGDSGPAGLFPAPGGQA